jgi:hypothetical protein
MRLLITSLWLVAAPLAAQPALTDLTYRGAPVKAHKGATADFPAEFTDKLICEGGVSAPTKSAGCIQMNRDGSGTWENDAGPGTRMPPAPVSWFIVTNAAGQPLKNDGADRKTWQIIFRFEVGDRFNPKDSLYAVPASLITGPPKRAVVHSKYRDF